MNVLVVDSDATLLQEVRLLFQSLPQAVLTHASDAESALRKARALGQVELLLVDPFLPDLDGFTLRTVLHALFPSLQTVFFARQNLHSYAPLLHGAPFFPRPPAAAELLSTLHTFASQHIPLAPLQLGQDFGPFRLLQSVDENAQTQRFLAHQLSLNRNVLLTVLRPEARSSQELRASFLADASAKARVAHPVALTLFEAGEIEGRLYYASEILKAPSLDSLLERGKPLPLPQILALAHSVSSFLLHLQNLQIPALPLSFCDILVPVEGFPRVQNPAVAAPPSSSSTAFAQDLTRLGAALLSLLPEDAPPPLRSTLQRTQPPLASAPPISSFEDLLSALPAPEISLPGAPALLSLPSPTPAQTSLRPLLLRTALALTLLALFGTATWRLFPSHSAKRPPMPHLIAIPSGHYFLGPTGATQADLPAFWIDQTEISNAQYAHFLLWIAKHPDRASQFDHPDQPKGLSHRPENWNQIEIALSQRRPPPALDALLDLPVTGVSWWDAFAFAKWAGRELPSHLQWEAAARGTQGLRFPWGDRPDPSKAHVQQPTPFASTSPTAVLLQPDQTPLGVLAMAGNVAEWTSSRPAPRQAVVKGGHFQAPLTPLEASSTIAIGEKKPYLGFRTISYFPPPSSR